MSHLFSPDSEPFTIPTSTSPPVNISGLLLRSSPPSAPPLLLLHGFPQSHIMYHKMAPLLSQHYTLIIPSLRGYGTSSKPHRHPLADPDQDPNNHSSYAKSVMARDMIALMDALGYEGQRFFICGHDRGARVAHKLCVDFPARVRKAMVLDIVPTKHMFESWDLELSLGYWHWGFLCQPGPLPEAFILGAKGVWAEHTFAQRGGGNREIFAQEARREYEGYLEDWETVHGMCEDYRAARSEDWREQQEDEKVGRRIRCPLRVLWGTEGVVGRRFKPAEVWRHYCEEGMVDAGSEGVQGGHYIPEERPEEVVRHIKEFFV
ncbi:MAG: hypothetical protein LQ351_006071 [Letrouitia transgressa]|nr:MAG: hypothetical protein LQ351_006071 [Letrouitia transgressa]